MCSVAVIAQDLQVEQETVMCDHGTMLEIRFPKIFVTSVLGGSVSRFGFRRCGRLWRHGQDRLVDLQGPQGNNVNVRGFIRNVTKARERLGCVACDEASLLVT